MLTNGTIYVVNTRPIKHSFRQSMRDRLRAVECPKEIIDQINGWSSTDIREGYGEGFDMKILHKWTNSL